MYFCIADLNGRKVSTVIYRENSAHWPHVSKLTTPPSAPNILERSPSSPKSFYVLTVREPRVEQWTSVEFSKQVVHTCNDIHIRWPELNSIVVKFLVCVADPQFRFVPLCKPKTRTACHTSKPFQLLLLF